MSLIQNKTENLIPEGHEIAWDEFILQKEKGNKNPSSNINTLEISKTEENITIKNEKTNVIIDAETGEIQSWSHEGKVITKAPIKPNFWRPPTDNDLGSAMDSKNIEWKNATLNNKITKFEHQLINKIQVKVSVNYSLPGVKTTHKTDYIISGDGTVKITSTLNKTEYKADLPRLGMRLQILKEFDNVTYYGRGPWENYQDRKTSTFIDIFKNKVTDFYVPYIRPQENGNRTNVRWMALVNKENDGLLISTEIQKGLSISALHMPNEDFDITDGLDYSKKNKNANFSKHTTDIKEQDLIQLNIDLNQRGLAGDDSWWSKPQEEYQIKGNKELSYSFYLIPFTNGNKNKFIEYHNQSK